MWKKAVVGIISFICICFSAYAYENHMLEAANNPFTTGGSTWGRIGDLKPYDTFYLSAGYQSGSGVGNVDHVSWMAVDYRYKSSFGGILAIANDMLGPATYTTDTTLPSTDERILTSNLKVIADEVAGNLTAKDKAFIVEHDLSITKRFGSKYSGDKLKEYQTVSDNEMPYVFAAFETELRAAFSFDTYVRNYVTGAKILYTNNDNAGGNGSDGYLTGYDFTNCATSGCGNVQSAGYSLIDINEPSYFLPCILYKENVTVFSTSPIDEVDVDANKEFLAVQSPDYTPYVLGNNTLSKGTGAPLKIRMLDAARTVSFTSISSIHDSTNKPITKAARGSKVNINYNNATVSTSDDTISLLITNSANEFLYYKPLKTAQSSDSIQVDLKDLSNGTYNLYLVNEEVSDSYEPAYSSALSEVQTLEIVEPVTIQYTNTVGTPAYSDALIQGGAVVGYITPKNGVSPYSYNIVSDGTDGNTYFILASAENANGTWDVLVNSTKAPNGLPAGTYTFIINGSDANGDTITPINVMIQVNKASAAVSFNTTSTSYIALGSNPITEQITYSNPELSIGGVVPNYTWTGGISGIGFQATGSTTNLNDFDISIGSTTSSSLPTSFTLTVTTPETDNYLSATDTKQVMVYDVLSGLTWTPAKVNFSPSDVTNGKSVGTLEAVGGYGPYTYSILQPGDIGYTSADGADYGSFTIDATPIPSGPIDVNTNTTLAVGQAYHIQMKVEDSLGNIFYQNAVINVIANSQAPLYYKDSAGGNVITTFSLTYPDSTKSLLAEGGSGSGAITYGLAPASVQPPGITPSDYLTVGLNNGALTPLKPGTVIVRAMKAKDSIYASTYVDIPVTILPATQSLAWSGSSIRQVSGSSDTWEMEAYWSGGTDIYQIQELLNGAVLQNDIGITTNVTGASTSIPFQYSIIASNTDQAFINLSSNTLSITGTPTGIVQIEAKRGGEQGFGDSAPIYLNLHINSLPELQFTFDVANGCSGSMAAASTCTLSTAKLGDLSLKPATSGFTYSIKSAEYDASGTGNSYTTAPGIFTLANTTEIKINRNLSNGIYRLTFTASDGTYTLDDLVTTITINNNVFNTASWTWEAGDINSLTAISGTMNGSTNEYATAYSRVYAPAVNGVNDCFEVELKGIPSKATITYDVSSTNVANVISHSTNAIFSVDGVGGGNASGNHTVFVEATVSMSGYSDVTVYLPIEITKYTQTIGFANNTAIFLPSNGVCTSIPSASVTSTHSNFASPGNPITYAPDAGSNSAIRVNGNQVCSVSGTTSSSARIIATLDGDTNYSDATTTKNVVLYAPGTITVSQSIQTLTGGASNITYTPGAHIVAHDSSSVLNGTASQNAKVANVKLTGMAGSASYAPSTNNNAANRDQNFFSVHPASGDITLLQDITAIDILGQGNVFYIQVDVTDPHGFMQTVDVQIVIDDAIAEFYFHDGGTPLPTSGTGSGIYVDGLTGIAKYTEPYAPNGTITRIETNRGDAVYSVDTASNTASDVIHLISGYTYGIDNATDEQGSYGGSGGKAYAKACISAGSGYQAQCIYAEVEIIKAEQTGFAFAQDPLYLTVTTSSITPLYRNHYDGQDVLISNSDHPSIVDAGTYTPGADQELQVYGIGGPVEITATTQGNRNYEGAIAKTHVHVTSRPATTLTVDVNPKPIYYGETQAIAKINAGYQGTLPAYFSSSDPSIVEVKDASTGDNSSSTLIIKKVGTVDIEVCQTDQAGFDAGDPCPSGADYGYKTITILPRSVTLKLKDESIYTGEAMPTYSFAATAVAGSFANKDTIADFPLPNNTNAMDGSNIVSNSAVAGTYSIQGSYSSSEAAGSFLSNYQVTIQDGELEIKQDVSDSTWYYLEGASTGNLLSPNTWYNEDVYVKLDPAKSIESAGGYDEISDTILFTNADKTKYLVSNEDDNTKDVYFRIDPNGGTAHAGAISSKQTTSVKIDKTAPKVTGAKGTPSTNNILEDLINVISFNTFFKPGVEVIIHTEDSQPQGSTQSVSVSGVKDVDYTIYEVDEKTGAVDASKAPTTGSGSVDANGEIKFNIPKVGAYKVCAIAHDNAGNPSGEECYYVNVKHINIDVDDDGNLDFNDSDQDGCPDLNIKWKDPKDDAQWIILNGDRDQDGIPDLNIDANGDGIADLNIDTDRDGKPDINLVDLVKEATPGGGSVWTPSKCVQKDEAKGIMEEYCTGTNVQPQINVDTNKDGIPDINIDTIGDFKPHYNIAKDGETTPYLNIGKVHTSWKPDVDYLVDQFSYDSIGVHDPILNIDTDQDGLPDINIDFNNDQIPDLNIDINGDGIPDINIDSDGDGIADINLDPDADGVPTTNVMPITEWKPNKNGTHDQMEFDTMVIERVSNLEDQGMIVEAPANQKFLPNYALKVHDYTKEADASEIKLFQTATASDMEVKQLLQVTLSDGTHTIQPNGAVKVKIPVDNSIEAPRIVIEQKDGTLKEVTVEVVDGFFVFETDYLGKVAILGKNEPSPAIPDNNDPNPNPEPSDASSVQGSYTTGNLNGGGVGGSSTGDEHMKDIYAFSAVLSMLGVIFLLKKAEGGNKQMH